MSALRAPASDAEEVEAMVELSRTERETVREFIQAVAAHEDDKVEDILDSAPDPNDEVEDLSRELGLQRLRAAFLSPPRE